MVDCAGLAGAHAPLAEDFFVVLHTVIDVLGLVGERALTARPVSSKIRGSSSAGSTRAASGGLCVGVVATGCVGAGRADAVFRGGRVRHEAEGLVGWGRPFAVGVGSGCLRGVELEDFARFDVRGR